MPRISRMVNSEQKAVYHVMTRTALDGFPFKDVGTDVFVNIIKRFSKIYFTNDEIKERYARFYGDDAAFPVEGDPGEDGKIYAIACCIGFEM